MTKSAVPDRMGLARGAEEGVYALGERAVLLHEEDGGLDVRGEGVRGRRGGGREFERVPGEVGAGDRGVCVFDDFDGDGVCAGVEVAAGEGELDVGGGVLRVEDIIAVAVVVVERGMEIEAAMLAVDGDLDGGNGVELDDGGEVHGVTGRWMVDREGDGARSRGGFAGVGWAEDDALGAEPILGGGALAGNVVGGLPGVALGKLHGGAVEVADLEDRGPPHGRGPVRGDPGSGGLCSGLGGKGDDGECGGEGGAQGNASGDANGNRKHGDPSDLRGALCWRGRVLWGT